MPSIYAAFYHSPAWINTRAAYAASRGWLCERCYAKGILKAGDTVHHKIRLSPATIDNPALTLNFDNLELLCRECHAEEHEKHERHKPTKAAQRRTRYKIDAEGRVLLPMVPPSTEKRETTN